MIDELKKDLAFYEKHKEQIVADLNATLGALEYIKMKIDQVESRLAEPEQEQPTEAESTAVDTADSTASNPEIGDAT